MQDLAREVIAATRRVEAQLEAEQAVHLKYPPMSSGVDWDRLHGENSPEFRLCQLLKFNAFEIHFVMGTRPIEPTEQAAYHDWLAERGLT